MAAILPEWASRRERVSRLPFQIGWLGSSLSEPPGHHGLGARLDSTPATRYTNSKTVLGVTSKSPDRIL